MAAKSKRQQMSLTSVATRFLISGIVILLLLGLVMYLVFTWHARKDAAVYAEQQKTALNSSIELILGRYVDRVNLLAADPELADLVDDLDARLARQADLAKMIDAEMVLLFAKGEEKQLVGEFPLLSFSELDLVYDVDRSGHYRLEYHKFSDGKAYLDVVRSLHPRESTKGFILARFASESLIDAIKQLVQPGALVELSQLLSNGSTEVFISLGEQAIKNDGQAYSGDLSAAQWRLSYWQQPRVWQFIGVDWRIFYALVIVVVVGMLGLIMFGMCRLLKKRIVASASVLYEVVRDRIVGQWMGKDYNVDLVEFQPVLNNLQNLNWSGRSVSVEKVVDTNAQPDTPKRSAAEESEQGRKAFEQAYSDILYYGKRGIDVVETDDAESVKKPAKPLRKPGGKHTDQTSLSADKVKKQAGHPSDAPASQASDAVEASATGADVSSAIFRAYDIRGVVGKSLTENVVYQIGLAFGTEAWQQGEQTIVVGRDGRLSSQALSEALIKGLGESGRDVVNIGQVPTPVVYFATHYLNSRSAVMVTGSHNPVDYNGLKLVLQGETLAEDAIQKILRRIRSGDYAIGDGSYTEQNLLADYAARVQADVTLGRSLKVVIDCGNGVAGCVAPGLLRSLGCDVTELFCEVDGSFPNHHPDPSQVANLQPLIKAVERHQADIGLALDGDGDRLGVVDAQGTIIWPDRQLMLFARNVLQKKAGGQIIYDVKSSRHLHDVVEKAGGQALMWKSGHSLMKAKLKETNALLAGELSGHVFFNDRWYGFDDGLYTAVRLLEILSHDKRPSNAVFAELPNAVSTPELRVEMAEGEHIKLMQFLRENIMFPEASLVTIDGIRAEFKHGWGLVRASNTTPCLMFRFEADDGQALEHIKSLFRKQLQALAPELKLPF